ncbi:MAG: glycosyltransferase [Bacteroidales bacterium]|nr:glycosyltransferase [Bacteroidales bacterium]
MKEQITIAFPVYKRTDYFRTALDSAVNQTVKCKILVVDNNSPHDEFKKIIEEYNNPLIEYIKTSETVNQDENFNNCIRNVKTPWMTILHDDDYLHIQYVELAEKIIKEYGDKIGGFAVENHVSVEEWAGANEKVKLTDDIVHVKPTFFYFRQLTPFPGVLFRTQLGLDINGFDVPLHPIADLDFWRRLTENSTMLFVNQKMAYYRISPNQSTNRLIDDMVNNVYKYRLNLIRKRKVKNNLLTRFGVEYVRLINLDFFKSQYPHLDITQDYPNAGWMKFTRIITKAKLFAKLFDWYIRKLCFDTRFIISPKI